MVIGVDNAMKLFRESGMPYWRLYEGFELKPRNRIAESAGQDSPTDTTSTEKKLEDVLRMMQPGKYLLSARKKFTGTEGDEERMGSSQSGVNIRLEIPYANGMVPAITGVGGGAAPIGYVHKSEMELALVKQENDYKIKDLERKFDEFTKKKEPKPTAFDNFLDKHGKVVEVAMGLLMHKFMGGAQVGMHGFGELQQPQQQQGAHGELTADQKMDFVVNTLAKEDFEGSPEAAAELLYKFMHFIIQNPMQYAAFKPMILNTKTQAPNE